MSGRMLIELLTVRGRRLAGSKIAERPGLDFNPTRGLARRQEVHCVSLHSASSDCIHFHTRVSVQGWELVRDALEGYKDILLPAPGRSVSESGQLQGADHHNGSAQSKHSFTVHLLVIEIIAADPAGALGTSMCFILLLQASSERGSRVGHCL